MVDETRFPGDDTIGAYKGEFKAFLMYMQEMLRVSILCIDAFPKAIDFEETIRANFEAKARQVFKTKGENKPHLDSALREYANFTWSLKENLS